MECCTCVVSCVLYADNQHKIRLIHGSNYIKIAQKTIYYSKVIPLSIHVEIFSNKC